jgi:hypothetical protein
VQAYKVVMDISQIFKDDEDTTATTTTEWAWMVIPLSLLASGG